jgi:hypothetical protein
VAFIAGKLKGLPLQGRVIKATADEVYISAGQRTGCAVGDVFTVYSVGEALVDPETGEKLGQEEKKLGTVKVTDVQEKFAKAKPDGELKGVKAGDAVRAQ